MSDFVEKRKHKRLDLSLPAKIRHISGNGKEDTRDAVTINISFNGAYIVNIKTQDLKADDKLGISLSVPRSDATNFPFSRLVGKARIVRVEKDGVALEFDRDMHRLFVAD